MMYMQSHSRSHLCSQLSTCEVKSSVRRIIEHRLNDPGASFNGCLELCRGIVKGTLAKACKCYCTVYHDPCPSSKCNRGCL